MVLRFRPMIYGTRPNLMECQVGGGAGCWNGPSRLALASQVRVRGLIRRSVRLSTPGWKLDETGTGRRAFVVGPKRR